MTDALSDAKTSGIAGCLLLVGVKMASAGKEAGRWVREDGEGGCKGRAGSFCTTRPEPWVV